MTICDHYKEKQKEEARKKVEALKREIECPKDFKCVKENFTRLCKVREFGFDEHLECLDDNPSHCPFAVPFIYRHVCICPIRKHLIKKLKK